MSTLGFIGFGEAAYHIAKGLSETSRPQVLAFDVMAASEPEGEKIRSRAAECAVGLMGSLRELIDASEVILCATSAKYALSIAEEAGALLRKGKIYADLNSASPMVKRKIATIVDATGASFSDAAVMELVPPHKHRVPIAASGSGALEFTDILNAIGMNVTFINDQAGSSSSMKMFRSIFMRSDLPDDGDVPRARKMGVCDEVVEIRYRVKLRGHTSGRSADLLINRTAVAYDRRISENGGCRVHTQGHWA